LKVQIGKVTVFGLHLLSSPVSSPKPKSITQTALVALKLSVKVGEKSKFTLQSPLLLSQL
jgi:hypothetical protein